MMLSDWITLGCLVVMIGCSVVGGYVWGRCDGYIKRMDEEDAEK